MASPTSSSKSPGLQAQITQGMDKGIHWAAETLQRGDWRSVALGTAMVGLSLLAMFYVFPHLMRLDFHNMSLSSSMMLVFAGALAGLGLKGILSPASKNLKLSARTQKIVSIAVAILIPVLLMGYGATMMVTACGHHAMPGTNGWFWIGGAVAAAGLGLAAAGIRGYLGQRDIVRGDATPPSNRDYFNRPDSQHERSRSHKARRRSI